MTGPAPSGTHSGCGGTVTDGSCDGCGADSIPPPRQRGGGAVTELCDDCGLITCICPAVRSIRRIREALGITQSTLARRLGVTQTCVSYWESGRRQPGLDDLARLAAVLGTTIAALVTGPGCQQCMDTPPPGFMCLNCTGVSSRPGQAKRAAP